MKALRVLHHRTNAFELHHASFRIPPYDEIELTPFEEGEALSIDNPETSRLTVVERGQLS
jgi:hypothetical protein